MDTPQPRKTDILNWVLQRIDGPGALLSVLAVSTCIEAFQLSLWILVASVFASISLALWHFLVIPPDRPLDARPRKLLSGASKRPVALALTLLMGVLSSATYSSVNLFWPSQTYTVYDSEAPVDVGLRNLHTIMFPVGAALSLLVLEYVPSSQKPMMACSILLPSAVIMLCALMGFDLAAPNARSCWTVAFPMALLSTLSFGGIVLVTWYIGIVLCRSEALATFTGLNVAARAVGSSLGYLVSGKHSLECFNDLNAVRNASTETQLEFFSMIY